MRQPWSTISRRSRSAVAQSRAARACSRKLTSAATSAGGVVALRPERAARIARTVPAGTVVSTLGSLNGRGS